MKEKDVCDKLHEKGFKAIYSTISFFGDDDNNNPGNKDVIKQ